MSKINDESPRDTLNKYLVELKLKNVLEFIPKKLKEDKPKDK